MMINSYTSMYSCNVLLIKFENIFLYHERTDKCEIVSCWLFSCRPVISRSVSYHLFQNKWKTAKQSNVNAETI